MKFSGRLKVLRKEKGLSQEKLAELLNVSRQSVSKWEAGQTYPEIDKLIILSDFFNITLDDLIKGKSTEGNIISNNSKIDEKDEDSDENFIIGGFIIGISFGIITGNFMLGTVGAFIGIGVPYIIKGIKGIINT
ncbi:helix-turn-helix transcriptional regulator [Clostridium sp. D2Q-11]|uniref:Helix-turn-helix transcriptional regulator n=1 Tax=Anaeromonas frigoriresistens TaxID=2683708 RepID=A0A942UW74_9FIRM|nr:helix-turn-helix transcriptional regulator [Anaeromonas frigoriresistens]MBS4537541.1 helix-turn-helix transcriptional regulator [Anaeromonas frigoriresistens]